jgi:acyl-coenzyme A thioesterase PaaI-like protein
MLTAELSVQFLRPLTEGRVTATGRVTKPGKTLFFVDSVITREDGEEVGRGRGSFTCSTMPLGDIVLYR